MGKKGKAERKPKQRAQQQAPRPGQDAFGESGERSAYARPGSARRRLRRERPAFRSSRDVPSSSREHGGQQQARAKRLGQPQQRPEM